MKLCVISDVHGKWKKLKIPECDVLISCGDYSFKGEAHMVRDFHKWLGEQDARYIISVQGNHELAVEKNFDLYKKMAEDACPGGVLTFIDEGLVEIEGVKIWCSAITPTFFDWAWNRDRGPQIDKHWQKIPEDIDILVTHGPPHGILDVVSRGNSKENVGCHQLWNRLKYLTKLKHHFFGHIHGGYGHVERIGIHFWNASNCDEQYQAVNEPHVVEFIK